MKAHGDLVAALEDLHNWEESRRKATELLKETVQIRSEAARLCEAHDIRWVPGS